MRAKYLLPVNGFIGAGELHLITVFPQVLYRASAFFIPEEKIARAVTIRGFQVGAQSNAAILFGGRDFPDVPGEYFWAKCEAELTKQHFIRGDLKVESRFPLDLQFDTAEVGNSMGVMVRNDTDHDIQFHGVFYGDAAL